MSDIIIGTPVTTVVTSLPKDETVSLSFIVDKILGSGSFGVVYHATLLDSNKSIAIKKVLQDNRYKNRELQIMSRLNHPNVVKLRYYYYSVNNSETYLNLIMDYYPDTLYSVIKTYARQRQTMPLSYIRLYSYQMLRSLAYLHSVDSICHRDIKPQNLLVDHMSGKLVLIDFGSAKSLTPGVPNVSYICSRYYRAPELIFGATQYTPAIDLWSAGCVIAELILGVPLFPGETGVDQLVEIIRVLGTPTAQQIKEMNEDYLEDDFPMVKAQSWSTVLKSAVPPEAIDLIAKLLVYSPEKRMTALESLAHPFFDALRADNEGMASRLELFDFDERETYALLDLGLYEKACPFSKRKVSNW